MPEWLTYAQIAERFGLTPDAVRMRARRLHWRMQPGNDGKTLVQMPDDADLQPRPRSPEGSPERAAERSPEQEVTTEQLFALLDAADARAVRAEQRAEQAEQRADEAGKRQRGEIA